MPGERQEPRNGEDAKDDETLWPVAVIVPWPRTAANGENVSPPPAQGGLFAGEPDPGPFPGEVPAPDPFPGGMPAPGLFPGGIAVPVPIVGGIPAAGPVVGGIPAAASFGGGTAISGPLGTQPDPVQFATGMPTSNPFGNGMPGQDLFDTGMPAPIQFTNSLGTGMNASNAFDTGMPAPGPSLGGPGNYGHFSQYVTMPPHCHHHHYHHYHHHGASHLAHSHFFLHEAEAEFNFTDYLPEHQPNGQAFDDEEFDEYPIDLATQSHEVDLPPASPVIPIEMLTVRSDLPELLTIEEHLAMTAALNPPDSAPEAPPVAPPEAPPVASPEVPPVALSPSPSVSSPVGTASAPADPPVAMPGPSSSQGSTYNAVTGINPPQHRAPSIKVKPKKGKKELKRLHTNSQHASPKGSAKK